MPHFGNTSPEAWADHVVYTWRQMGLRLNKGAADRQITALEKETGFAFDPYFKALYRLTDGFHSKDLIEVLLVVWPLDQIADEWQGFKQQNFIGFADYLINS